jgi:DNA/RNA-binding domain of Phe-tRNA-synthetase-like protein
MSHGLKIDAAVFEKLPGLRVFVAVVRDVQSADAAGISALLTAAWKTSQAKTSQHANVQSHPRIAAWRKAYAALGVSVKKHASSIESLARRAAKDGSAPCAICPLVDFYNAASLSLSVPLGGFDLDDERINGVMSLRFTGSGDVFTALDESHAMALPPNEACYAVGSTVVTRHVNWRQSREGLITDRTRNAVFMAEVLDGVDAVDELRAFFTTHCRALLGADAELIAVLSADNPAVSY